MEYLAWIVKLVDTDVAADIQTDHHLDHRYPILPL
jgi:hypothetical protein